MGTFMDDALWSSLYASVFVFDLEYVGTSTDLKDCHIWEIGMIHYASGEQFSVTIVPDLSPLPPPFSAEFVQLTPSFLAARDAVSFKEAWSRMRAWMARFIHEHSNVLLVAHNAFKADKPMLEVDTRRHNIRIPFNWFFFDTLIYCRQTIPKLKSYALGDMYKQVLESPIHNAHEALSDTISLYQILHAISAHKLIGPIYPARATSLQAIKWLGPASERHLFSKNIRSVEQLKTEITTAYACTCLSSMIPIEEFIEGFLTSYLGLQKSNAISIAESVLQRWLD